MQLVPEVATEDKQAGHENRVGDELELPAPGGAVGQPLRFEGHDVGGQQGHEEHAKPNGVSDRADIACGFDASEVNRDHRFEALVVLFPHDGRPDEGPDLRAKNRMLQSAALNEADQASRQSRRW